MSALSLAPWLIALAALLGGGSFGLVERANYLQEKAARAQDLAAARQAALAAQVADAQHTKELEDQHAAEVAALKEQAHVRTLAIARAVQGAPVTDACAGSPAMRALFDGLRARSAAAGPGPAPAAGGARAAVPR
jgi:hypothetical protein